jgi:ankyrin repeat protein
MALTSKVVGAEALCRASINGHDKIVKVLLIRGFDFTKQSSSRQAALHRASVAGHIDVLKTLLAAGADSKNNHIDDRIALHLASADCHYGVVEVLIANGFWASSFWEACYQI